MNLVAPSPSRTMACAKNCATCVSAACRACPSALSKLLIGALPALPVAAMMKESLVEVSPSTVTALKDASATRRVSSCISAGATAASVAIKPNMVAIFGRIMPAPLLMPVMVMVCPPISVRRLCALGTVSVVMMAVAASPQFAGAAFCSAAGRAAMMRSCGSASMITPVLKGSTCAGAMPSCAATAAHTASARA